MKLVFTEKDEMHRIFIGEDREKIFEVSGDWAITEIEGDELSRHAKKFIITIEKIEEKEEDDEIAKLFREFADATPLPFF